MSFSLIIKAHVHCRYDRPHTGYFSSHQIQVNTWISQNDFPTSQHGNISFISSQGKTTLTYLFSLHRCRMSDKCQTAMPLSEGGKHALGETDTQQHLGPCVRLFHVIEGAVDLALWGQDAHRWLSPAMLIWKHVIRADSTGTDQGEKLCKHADFRLGTKTTFFDIVMEKDVWRLCSLVAQVSVTTGPHSAFRWPVWMALDNHILGTRP